MSTVTHRDSQQAFEDAIASGVLSNDSKATNYAGRYMYMHTEGAVDAFKHRDTRQYVYAEQVIEQDVDFGEFKLFHTADDHSRTQRKLEVLSSQLKSNHVEVLR